MKTIATVRFEVGVLHDPFGERPSENEEFILNILDDNEGSEVRAREALDAYGFLYVGRFHRSLEIWEMPGGSRPHSVFFLFREMNISGPIASSTSSEALAHLREAFKLIEDNSFQYTIKEHGGPS
jgi:hypothetical protein